MKISILTATYNRAKYLNELYDSLIENSKYEIYLEWLIMDDGSTDSTKEVINSFIIQTNNQFLKIKYYHQSNQGKMSAINNLVSYATGDLLIECDSDDYLKSDAVKTIIDKYNSIQNKNDIYALCFLKSDENNINIGNTFKYDNYKSNMFNLYFKDEIEGDKSLVFITKIRKQYKYIIEKGEHFCTEARMYNEMDKKYNIACFNSSIMTCEYLSEGYSKNIKKIYLENPFGFYEYFKQLLSFNMKGVLFNKRLYIIKHYILFSYLTKSKNILKHANGFLNKLLIILLYVPGVVKSWRYEKKD